MIKYIFKKLNMYFWMFLTGDLSMEWSRTLQVLYDGKLVGKLALTSGRKVAFQYSEVWCEDTAEEIEKIVKSCLEEYL